MVNASNYTKRFEAERQRRLKLETDQIQADETLSKIDAELGKEQNERLKQEWQEKLQLERDRRAQEDHLRMMALIEPRLERERRKWLYDHPTMGDSDWDRAESLIRENIIEEARQMEIDAARLDFLRKHPLDL